MNVLWKARTLSYHCSRWDSSVIYTKDFVCFALKFVYNLSELHKEKPPTMITAVRSLHGISVNCCSISWTDRIKQRDFSFESSLCFLCKFFWNITKKCENLVRSLQVISKSVKNIQKIPIQITIKHSSEFANEKMFYQHLIGILRMNHYIPPMS